MQFLKVKITYLQHHKIRKLPEHIYELENLPFHHKDPFDHLLIAQAMVEDYTLVTDDPKFSAYSAKLI